MAIRINNNVLRFQIPVKNFLGMQMSNSREGFQEVKLGIFLTHPSNFSQQIEKLSTVAVLHAEKKIIFSLETHVQLGDERMAAAQFQNGPLIFYDVQFVVLYYKLFVYDLHCEELAVPTAEVDPRETSSTHALYDFEHPQPKFYTIDFYSANLQLEPLGFQILDLPMA